jgi:hypothetical protein
VIWVRDRNACSTPADDRERLRGCDSRADGKVRNRVAALHHRWNWAAWSVGSWGEVEAPKEMPGEAQVPIFGVASGVAVVCVFCGKTERKT